MTDENGTNNTVQIRLGNGSDFKVRLFKPKLGRAYEIMYAVLKSDVKAGAAALGLSSKEVQKHVPWRHDVLDFGDKVIDFFLERGADYLALRDAAITAYNFVTDGLPTNDEVDEAEGFTEAPEDDSTT